MSFAQVIGFTWNSLAPASRNSCFSSFVECALTPTNLAPTPIALRKRMAFGVGSSNDMKMKGMHKEDNAYEGNALQVKGILKTRDHSFKNNLRVLFVDDDKVTRKVMMVMLRDLKVEGKEAVNGKEAMRLLRRMGVGVKLAGVSTHLTKKKEQGFLDAGANEFHMEPITRAKLVALLQAVDEEQ